MRSSKSSTTRTFYLAIGAIAIAGIATLGYLATRSGVEATPVDPNLPKVQSEGYVTGSDSALIEIIEYGDFECPACENFATLTKPDIQAQYVDPGLVRFRFIDYPLPMHRNTWDASRAAACADEQGKFWAMHDLLYANQDRWWTQATRNPSKVIKDLAQGMPGLDHAAFSECVDSKRTQAKVQAHLAMAEAQQIGSTPTFIINGKKIPGALPFDQMKRQIDEALAAARAAKAPAAP